MTRGSQRKRTRKQQPHKSRINVPSPEEVVSLYKEYELENQIKFINAANELQTNAINIAHDLYNNCVQQNPENKANIPTPKKLMEKTNIWIPRFKEYCENLNKYAKENNITDLFLSNSVGEYFYFMLKYFQLFDKNHVNSVLQKKVDEGYLICDYPEEKTGKICEECMLNLEKLILKPIT
jgi:hypothetical protein